VSDIGRYRKVFPRIWRHPGFQQLPKSARELALYLLTGPQTSRIGLFHFSVATAAEDLGVGVETLRKGLADITTTFGWHFDAGARVFYIPSWWRWNPPENENVLKGNLKDLSEIQPSGVVDAFTRNLETLPSTLHQTFVECCRIRLPQPSSTQEQYQGAQQESGSGAREPRPRVRRSGNVHPIGKAEAGTDRSIAMDGVVRALMHVTDAGADLDYLLNAFGEIALRDSATKDYTKSEALAALNRASLPTGKRAAG
jgi:hypothetical protein